jgi:hypothetical protein
MIAGYFAYTSSVVRLNLFESNSSANVDLVQLNLLLTKDFEEALTASLVTPTRLILKRNNSDEATYLFDENSVIRVFLTNSDTFNVKTNLVNSTPLAFDPVYISQLNISVESAGRDFLLVYGKNYTPFFYLNHNNR